MPKSLDDTKIYAGQIWAFTGHNPHRKAPQYHLKQFENIPWDKLGLPGSLDFIEFAVEVRALGTDSITLREEISVKVVKADGVGWHFRPGDFFTEGKKYFRENYKLLMHTFEVSLMNMEETNTCTKCGQTYEYANKAAGFVCWSCKNGY